MYAVFKSGGKQYRVKRGQIVRLEKLRILAGKTIEFKKVMMIVNGNNIKIGNPFVKESKIIAEIVAHGRADKVTITKFHRRKHFRKHQGHRQWFTDIRISSIGI